MESDEDEKPLARPVIISYDLWGKWQMKNIILGTKCHYRILLQYKRLREVNSKKKKNKHSNGWMDMEIHLQKKMSSGIFILLYHRFGRRNCIPDETLC